MVEMVKINIRSYNLNKNGNLKLTNIEANLVKISNESITQVVFHELKESKIIGKE